MFLDFFNAEDVQGPESEAEWRGATRLIHPLLGLPPDLTKHGVFHAFVDARSSDFAMNVLVSVASLALGTGYLYCARVNEHPE